MPLDQIILETPATAAPADAMARMGTDEVRPARPEDLPAIAGLFHSVFRHAVATPSPDLIAHLRTIYFQHPWQDAEMTSLVFVSANGSLDGFIGVLPLLLTFGEKKIRAAIAGALMVREPQERPLAGARLLRRFLAGPQDLSMGDTANWSSQTPWERLGGAMLPHESMEWVKVFTLSRFGANALANRLPRVVGAMVRPLGVVAGVIEARLRRRVWEKKDWSDAAVGDDDYLDALAHLSRAQDLAIDLDPTAGRWFLARAAEKSSLGTLSRRIVRDRRGQTIGCYLIYTRPGETAEVLMVTAHPKQADAVIASIMQFAQGQRCVAVKGRTQHVLMKALFRANCIMRHRCSTVVHTSHASLMQALESGRVSLGGFYGETWTRLVSDDFGQIRTNR